jgi:hypothetical protein
MRKVIDKDVPLLIRTTKDVAEFLKKYAERKNTSVNELAHYVLAKYKRNARVKRAPSVSRKT